MPVHHRPQVARVGLGEVVLAVAEEEVAALVVAVGVLEPALLHERGPALLEPGVAEVADHQEVAEVAVGHLVGVDLLHPEADLGGQRLVEEELVVPAHQGDVLHGAAEPRERELEVLGEGEVHPKLLRHPPQEVPGAAEGARQVAGVEGRGGEVAHRPALEVPVVEADEVAEGEAEDVAGAALLQLPVRRVGAVAVVDVLDQGAVGEDGEPGGGPEVELEGGAHRGQVHAGQPVPRPLGLVIGGGEARGLRVGLVGAGEEEAGGRPGHPVAHRHPAGLPLGDAVGPVEAQPLAVVVGGEEVAVGVGDRDVLETHRVEGEGPGAGAPCEDRGGHRALGGGGLEVDGEVDVEVDRLEAEVGGVLGLGPLGEGAGAGGGAGVGLLGGHGAVLAARRAEGNRAWRRRRAPVTRGRGPRRRRRRWPGPPRRCPPPPPGPGP